MKFKKNTKISPLRRFIGIIGLDWKRLGRNRIDKIADSGQYKSWLNLRRIKAKELSDMNEENKLKKKLLDKYGSRKERYLSTISDSSDDLEEGLLDSKPKVSHSVHVEKPHKHRIHVAKKSISTKKPPKLDVGQVRKTTVGKQPSLKYKSLLVQAASRGSELTRSAGSIVYKGTGKKAYKATKHSIIRKGKKHFTIPGHKGAEMHGGKVKSATSIVSDYSIERNDILSEKSESLTITRYDADHMLHNAGCKMKSGKKHDIFYHPNLGNIPVPRHKVLSVGVTRKIRNYLKGNNLTTESSLIVGFRNKLEERKNQIIEELIDSDKNIKNSALQKIETDKGSTIFVVKKTMTKSKDSDKNNIEINPELVIKGQNDTKEKNKEKTADKILKNEKK